MRKKIWENLKSKIFCEKSCEKSEKQDFSREKNLAQKSRVWLFTCHNAIFAYSLVSSFNTFWICITIWFALRSAHFVFDSWFIVCHVIHAIALKHNLRQILMTTSCSARTCGLTISTRTAVAKRYVRAFLKLHLHCRCPTFDQSFHRHLFCR